ncbi:MAG TPA: CAP domain-containing protein [Solirubrobacteraceae bacterium]|nr:CAP domain-containing protein [Solirubrobacteraceae bacterium]
MAHARFTSLLALTASLCATAAIGTLPGVAAASSCPNASLTPQPDNIGLVRAAVLCLINQERERHGESALIANPKLAHAAQGHSTDMASRDYFSHTAPGGETPLDRMRSSGYIGAHQEGYVVGENIAWGTLWLATPQAIVGAWMASPGHRANILEARYRETGVGVSPHAPAALAEGQAGAIYTQDFGTTATASRSSHSSASAPRGGRSAHGSHPRSSHRFRSRSALRHHPMGAGRITSASQTSEQRSHTHNGSTRRKVRHRHRVRPRHRARHRRAARRKRRAGAHQRSRRRHRQAGR